MKLGLFGGSFDPPHQGHLVPVRRAMDELGLDRVIYLPTSDPPHKPDRRMAPALARFAMVELALLEEPRLVVSDHELTPGRPSYTVETLEHFRRELPEAELHLVVGSDSMAQLHRWVRWRELLDLCRLVVLQRPGWGLDRVRAEGHPEVVGRLDDGRAWWSPEPAPDLSSTELRALLARGETPPVGAMAPPVLTYVQKYSLYR